MMFGLIRQKTADAMVEEAMKYARETVNLSQGLQAIDEEVFRRIDVRCEKSPWQNPTLSWIRKTIRSLLETSET